jgi:hypothetical protein
MKTILTHMIFIAIPVFSAVIIRRQIYNTNCIMVKNKIGTKTVCRYHILVHFFVFDREDKSLECLKTERLTTMGCGSLLDRNYKLWNSRHHDLCNHYRIPELRRVPLVEQGLLTLPVCPSLPLFLLGFILLDF